MTCNVEKPRYRTEWPIPGGMDDETERKIYEVIEDEARDSTILIIAHRLNQAARVCDLAIALSSDKRVENGEPKGPRTGKRGFFSPVRGVADSY